MVRLLLIAILLGGCSDKQRLQACETERDKREAERDAVMTAIDKSSQDFGRAESFVRAVDAELDSLDAKSPADRAVEMTRLHGLLRDAEAAAAEASREAARDARMYIRHQTRECLDNPLAKGCGD
jgi:hypothetical protein